jgi:hypothetical protein
MLQYIPIKETGTQRCCNISVFSGLQTEIDFDLLKKCIKDEFVRYECLRLRFTAPDEYGNVMQYIAERDDRDVPFLDLSDRTMKEADAYLQEKTFEEFNEPEIPMVEFTMVRMPEGYNGMYIHIDHRLVDSSGLITMVNDIMELYCHYRFGSDYPKPLASFEEVLISDLKKAKNNKRLIKDEKWWTEYLTKDGEPIYSDIRGPRILQETRKNHDDKSLRVADVETKDRSVGVADFHLEPDATKKLMDFCATQGVSPTNVILLVMRTYLSKANGGQEDITLRNFVSRRSTHAEWTCGGSRVLSFPLRTIISPDTEFLDALYELQNVQNKIYMHCNFDPIMVDMMLKDLYVLITGVIQQKGAGQRWFKEQPDEQAEYEFVVQKVEMLNEAQDKRTDGLNITLALNRLTPELADELAEQISSNKGQGRLHVAIYNPSTRQSVALTSRSHSIHVTPPLYRWLARRRGEGILDFKVVEKN